MKNAAAGLYHLFHPDSVAVVGASNNFSKLGFHVMKSLTSGGYAGTLYPINPAGEEIFGIRAYASLLKVPGPIDLVVVVVPAGLVPETFRQCVTKNVRGIVLITAGFKEIEDIKGATLHEEIKTIADLAGIPVIGPNTFGIVNYSNRLNATFTPEFSRAKAGGIALVSQSGGIAHMGVFLAMRRDMGLSSIIGLGNRLNVDFSEVLLYLAEDPGTDVIALYVEGVDAPRRMMKSLRDIRKKKRVVVYKTGRSKKGDLASKSHTGSLAGSHEAYMGAFRQSGILTVGSADELLDTAKALSRCSFPVGSRVAILSAQAGPGIAACDTCEALGLEMATFEFVTQERVNTYLPPLALRTNPVDMGPAWYDAEALNNIVRAVMEDPNVDGILLLTMFASANVKIIESLRETLEAWNQRKPVISCILAPEGIWDGTIRRLERAGALVNYPTPERAARALANLWRSAWLREH
jgi:acyl-CoA synthetase (NDP forming)